VQTVPSRGREIDFAALDKQLKSRQLCHQKAAVPALVPRGVTKEHPAGIGLQEMAGVLPCIDGLQVFSTSWTFATTGIPVLITTEPADVSRFAACLELGPAHWLIHRRFCCDAGNFPTLDTN
jgi:hypothetical protein